LIGRAVGVNAQHEVDGDGRERWRQLGGVFHVAGGELCRCELQAHSVERRARAIKMNVQRALHQRRVFRAPRAHGVVRIRLDERRAQRILHRALRHQAARDGRAVTNNRVRTAPNDEVFFIRTARREDGIGRPAQRIVWEQRSGEASIESQVHPVVHAVALAPPEKALRVVHYAGAVAQLDQAEKVVDICSREQDGVGEVHRE